MPRPREEPDQTEDTAEAATDEPTIQGPVSATEPVVGPDGHVHLSQEDIDARQ